MASFFNLIRACAVAFPLAGLLTFGDDTGNTYPEPPNPDIEEEEQTCACDDSNIDGSGNGQVSSLRYTMSCGISPLGDLPAGKLKLYAIQPSADLFTPRRLVYEHTLADRIQSVKTAGLASGVAREVIMTNSQGKNVTYRFMTSANTGYPTQNVVNDHSWLKMKGTSDELVSDNPAVYEMGAFDSQAVTRYNAMPPYTCLIYRNETGGECSLSDCQINIVRESNGTLRQIKTAYCLGDIIVPAGYAGKKYEIRFYNVEQVGTASGDGVYPVSGNPFVVFTIENPLSNTQPMNVDHIRITRTANNTNEVWDYSYVDAQKMWTLVTGSGLRSESLAKVENPSTGMESKIRTLRGADKEIIYKSIETLKQFAWGKMVVERIEGDASTTQITKNIYWENSSQVGKYGRLKGNIGADGAWTMYDYDENGRTILIVRPIGDTSWDVVKDMPLEQAATIGKATRYSYVSLDGADPVDVTDNRPRTTTEAAQGIITSISYMVYKKVNNEATIISEKAVTQWMAYGSAGNLRTTTVYYASAAGKASAGRIKSVTQPDGRITSYTYELGDFLRGVDFGAAAFTTAPTGQYLRTTVQTSPLIACKSTRLVMVVGMGGRTIHEETQVLATPDNWERIAWTGYQFNLRGQVTRTVSSDGSHSEATWGCCNKESEVLDDGTEMFYDYDALKRLTQTIKKGTADKPDLAVINEYDAAGNVTKTIISGGGISLQSTTEYDILGRVTNNVDATGLVTTYIYSPDGRTKTVIQPGGGTIVTTRFTDGRVKSISGTATATKEFEYGVNADGTLWEKCYAGAIGAPMWKKNTTDYIGHAWLTETPCFGGGVLSVIDTYDPITGHNIKSEKKINTQSIGAPNLFVYDELGKLFRSGIDVDNNGTLDLASNDRIEDADSCYEKDIDGTWWAKGVASIYPTGANGTPVAVNTSYRQLTGLGSDQGDGFILTDLSKSVDVCGNETISKAIINRTTKTTKRITTSAVSSLPAVQTIIGGLLVSDSTPSGMIYAIGYDSLGRQIKNTDPRTGDSITHYNDKGQVDFIQDAAGNQTRFTYEQQTGRLLVVENALGNKKHMAYDIKGRLTRIWGDTEYPIEKVYDDQGRHVQLKTFRGGTGWDQATWPTDAGTADVTTWIYDAATGLMTQKLYADGHGPAYTYDAIGRLSTRTWARTGDNNTPISTVYAYDQNTGELTGVSYSNFSTSNALISTPAITYTYDRLGRQASVIDAVGTRTFTYNNWLQPLSETINGIYSKTITRHYAESGVVGRYAGFDLNGNANYNNTISYDTYGRLAAYVFAGSGTMDKSFTCTYLPNSSLCQSLFGPSSLINTFAYEANRDNITAIENKIGSTSISKHEYSYDKINRRSTVIQTGNGIPASFIKWSCNSRSEVVSAQRYAGADPANMSSPVSDYAYSFNFDNIGNRLTANENSATKAYASNSLNQYGAITTTSPEPLTSKALDYDVDGNQTIVETANGSWLVTYNAENRPVKFENSSKTIECLYDYMGRRVEKKVLSGGNIIQQERFVYDGYKLIEVLDSLNGNATSRQFAWSGNRLLCLNIPSAAGASKTYEFLTDANKNVTEVVSIDSGALAAHYEYGPFGQISSMSGELAEFNPLGFSSEYNDAEIGLIYYNYRHYNPTDGRWLNRDPMNEKAALCLYAFCDNSPIDFADFLGLEWEVGKGTDGKPSNTWMAGADGDSMKELAKKVSQAEADWVCIWPKGAASLWAGYPTAKKRACADVSNLTNMNGKVFKMVARDFSGDKTIAGIKLTLNDGMEFVDGDDAAKKIAKESGQGKTPIGLGYFGGHHIIQDELFGPGMTKKFTASSLEEIADVKSNKGNTFENAKKGIGPVRCWFTRNATVYGIGCNTNNGWMDTWAQKNLRNGAQAKGTVDFLYGSGRYGITYDDFDGVDLPIIPEKNMDPKLKERIKNSFIKNVGDIDNLRGGTQNGWGSSPGKL